MTRILLLAGTAEARALAGLLSTTPRINLTASFAGATMEPATFPCPTRTGGFGGAEGLARWMHKQHTDLLIDATHPFAAKMQTNAFFAGEKAGIPHLRVLRPAWPNRPKWLHAADMNEAAQRLPSRIKVLITTGRKDLAPFIARPDVQFTLRSIEPVSDLPPHIQPLRARPPFSIDSERALFALLGVTYLVTKNAGGSGTAKLDVADEMRLSTVMVARPAPPPGAIAASPEAAVAWVRDKVAF
ncbi:MAG: cobalt-precorrin-6A reductase [Paracoccaceae bacterium]